jgi:cytochrome c6
MKNWLFWSAVLVCLLPSCESSPAPVGTALDVAKLYGQKCSLCHGDDGKMAVSGAKDLRASTLSREEVVAQITYGKGSMPPQHGILTPEQIEQLADYTMNFRTKNP